jgi:hypothetical protein
MTRKCHGSEIALITNIVVFRFPHRKREGYTVDALAYECDEGRG